MVLPRPGPVGLQPSALTHTAPCSRPHHMGSHHRSPPDNPGPGTEPGSGAPRLVSSSLLEFFLVGGFLVSASPMDQELGARVEVLEMSSKGFESLLVPNGLWSADRARHAEASLTGTRLLKPRLPHRQTVGRPLATPSRGLTGRPADTGPHRCHLHHLGCGETGQRAGSTPHCVWQPGSARKEEPLP